MEPCLKVGRRPASIIVLQRHLQASGKNTSLTRLNSLFCRPMAIGNAQMSAARKLAVLSVNPLGHFLPYRLPTRRRKHRVKWKIAAAEPKMAPNLETSQRSLRTAFVTLLVDISSNRNLIMAVLIKLRTKGGPAH